MQRLVHTLAVFALLASFSLATQRASALTPFSVSQDGTISQGFYTYSFAVPANEIFVEESISGRVQVATGQQLILLDLFQDNGASSPSSAQFPLYQLMSKNVFTGQFPVDIYGFQSSLRYYYQNTVIFNANSDDGNLPGRISYSISGYLIPALTGDFNANGTVDAADYVAYRSTLGQSGTGLFADGNDNNTIDPGDYAVWRSLFGTPAMAAGGSLGGTAVPEPTTLVLLMLAATVWCFRRGCAA